VGKPYGRQLLGDLGVEGRIILKNGYILKYKLVGLGWIRLRILTSEVGKQFFNSIY
jgi:hypothetical protein